MDPEEFFPYEDLYILDTIKESDDEYSRSKSSKDSDEQEDDFSFQIRRKKGDVDYENGWYFMLTSALSLITLKFKKKEYEDEFDDNEFLKTVKIFYFRAFTIVQGIPQLISLIYFGHKSNPAVRIFFLMLEVGVLMSTFFLKPTTFNIKRITGVVYFILFLIAFLAIFAVLPGQYSVSGEQARSNLETQTIPLTLFITCNLFPLFALFVPWRVIAIPSFFFAVTFNILLYYQMSTVIDIATVGLSTMSTSILTRYVFELYQKYSFLVSKKNKLLIGVLDSVESPSFILDSSNYLYWSNKAAKKLLGFSTGERFDSSLFINRELRYELLHYQKAQDKQEDNFFQPAIMLTGKGKKTAVDLILTKTKQAGSSFFTSLSLHVHKEADQRMEMFLDKDLVIEFTSRKVASFFQKRRKDMEGVSLQNLLYSCRAKEASLIIQRIQSNDQSMTVLHVGREACHLHHRWIRGPSGLPAYIYLELFVLNQDSEELRIEKEASKRNKQFLEYTSREIRNPLTIISGHLFEMSTLPEKEVCEETKCSLYEKNIKAVHLCVESIKKTITTSLSIERIRMGETTLRLFKFKLSSILFETFHFYESYAKVKCIDFHWEVDHILLNQTLVGDIEKIILIIRRYLDNAMKCAKKEEGSVSLRCCLLNEYFDKVVQTKEEKVRGGYLAHSKQEHYFHDVVDTYTSFDEELHRHMTIEVEDNGNEVEEKELNSLFTEYKESQLEDDSTNKKRRGLSVCKLKAEAMGGSVGFSSTSNGRGSLFYVTLPLYFDETSLPEDIKTHVEQKIECQEKKEPFSSSMHPIDIMEWQQNSTVIEKKLPQETTILVCEEIASVRKLITHRLNTLGIRVIQESRSVSVMNHLNKREGDQVVDILIMDEGVLNKTGKETLLKLRKQKISLPILMMTASVEEDNELYALLANNVIAKPFSSEELTHILSDYVIFT